MKRLFAPLVVLGLVSTAAVALAQPIQSLKVRDFAQRPGPAEYAKCDAEDLDVTMTCEAENAHLLNCRVSAGKGGAEASPKAFCLMKWVAVKPTVEGTIKFPLRGEGPSQPAANPKEMSTQSPQP
jgi:hypothetical protein